MSTELDADKKIVMLKYNISRFDHYYASVNFKSSFLVLGNITILGFLLNEKSISFYTGIIVFLIFTSLVYVLLAIKPYLKPYEGSGSIVFFGDIANDESIFKNKVRTLSQEEYILDLQEQVYILAKGLKKKFSYLNFSTILFIINIILFFVKVVCL